LSADFFDLFKRTYWMVGTRDDQGYGQGCIYTTEEAAYKAAEDLGWDLIERHDPDGTKTVIA
jgi:hypothetical protein